jgi:hypothetical protein
MLSSKMKRKYNDFAIVLPSISFAEGAVAIGKWCGDKNRCNR